MILFMTQQKTQCSVFSNLRKFCKNHPKFFRKIHQINCFSKNIDTRKNNEFLRFQCCEFSQKYGIQISNGSKKMLHPSSSKLLIVYVRRNIVRPSFRCQKLLATYTNNFETPGNERRSKRRNIHRRSSMASGSQRQKNEKVILRRYSDKQLDGIDSGTLCLDR